MWWKTTILAVTAICLAAGPVSGENPIGELGLAVGGIFPQGDFARYTDPGLNFMIRLNVHIPKVKAVSGWFDIGGSAFARDEDPVFLLVDDIALPAKKEESESGFYLHLGVQLGSASRRGFFRPRAALAPGLYIFNTRTTLRPLDYEEDLFANNNTQVRLGWRGAIGADFFFSTKWGISVSFLYDHVLNLHRVSDVDELGNTFTVSRSARFHSFMIGAVIPFEEMDD